jgi:hypothetical protein
MNVASESSPNSPSNSHALLLGSGFRLNTQGFTVPDCELLCYVLKVKFDLNCTIHKNKGKPVIYIRVDSMERFRSLVSPYFHDSMLYKLS